MNSPIDLSTSLEWIRNQQQTMTSLLETWANTNSGSGNPEGLFRMYHLLLESFVSLGGRRALIPLSPSPHIQSDGEIVLKPNANAFLIRQRCRAPLRILLGGHMDTVFDLTSKFQKCRHLPDERLQGPGVADMKGGLLVLLFALKALEKSPYAENIGWDVLITPDEETGSVASTPLWRQMAWQNHIGLIFEPSFTDGSIVSERKGSNTYYAIAHGKKAHAGRDFLQGKSAVAALSTWISEGHKLNTPTTFINFGYVHGGEAANIVPDKAYTMLNVRAHSAGDLISVEKALKSIAQKVQDDFGVTVQLYLKSRRPPKPCDNATQGLIDLLKTCGSNLNISIQTKSTGGVCDGNNIAAEGLPTIDTLGVQGGGLHTHEEWMWLPSLTQRACLTASLLITLAANAPSKELLALKLSKQQEYAHDKECDTGCG